MAESKITYVLALDTSNVNSQISKVASSLDKLGAKKGQKIIDFDKASIKQIEDHLTKLLKLQEDIKRGARDSVKQSPYSVVNKAGTLNTGATTTAVRSAIGKVGDAYVQKVLLEVDKAKLAESKANIAKFFAEKKAFEDQAYKELAAQATKELKLKEQMAKVEADKASAYTKQTAQIQTLVKQQADYLAKIEATKKAQDAITQSLLTRLNAAKLDTITQASNASAKASIDYRQKIEEEALNRRQQLEQQKIQWLEQARLNVENKIETASLASIARVKAADLARLAAIQAREDALQAHRASMMQTAQGGIYNGAMLGSGAASSKPTNYTPDLRASADKQTGLIKGMYETQTAYNERVKEAIKLLDQAKTGVMNLDKAHKPFLERIFDLVVGYKLINAAVNTFTNAMRSVPEAGLQFETTYATLKATFSVTTKVNEQLAFLDKLAQDAGISIDALRTSFVEFAASAKFSGESVGNIQEIFANISKAGMVLHLPADKMKSAFTALNQMYAKNQVMMEELKRQLGNQLPAAVNIFALSMGKTTRQLMDDMKKGLVVPKETLLNFSRTYAAMFSDPASLSYASQGVNAHIQRLSTAWTNFATTVYEQSKGAIKGGLSLATSAVDFLTKHINGLTNVVVVLGTTLGVALVSHLGMATKALLLTRNAASLAASSMVSLEVATASVAGLSIWANLKMFATSTLAAIPPWLKLVAVIGTAVMVLKDLEVGTVNVMSSLNQIGGKAVEVQKSITVSDLAIASWDMLIEKATKYWDMIGTGKPTEAPKNFINALDNQKQPTIGQTLYKYAPLRPVYEAVLNRAGQDAKTKAIGEEAARQTEYINEKVKEALLAGTTGTVDETMAGMNKTVTIALQRITTEFDIATQRLQGQTSLRVKELQLELTKVQSQEALGTITKGQSLSKVKAIQDEIYKANKKALADENSLLKEQLRRVELIGDAKLDNSKQAIAASTQEDKLAKLREARANIVGILPTLKDSPFKDQKSAEEALGSGTLSQALKTLAVEEWNKNNPTKPLFDKIDVTNTAIMEQTKALNKARDEYAKITTEHTALQMRVAEGTTTSNDLLEKIVTNTDPAKVTPVEFTGVASAGASATTATDSAKKAIEFFISKGWKPEQAMGITANIQGESSFNTGNVGDGGVAYGLGQWHPDRQANFAKAFGKSIKGSSFEDQLAFVDWELKNTEARAGNLLKATKTVAEATNSVTANYERPKYTSKDQAIRRDIAKSYLPSAGYVKSGADPIAQNALDIQRKLEANTQKGLEQDIEKQQADIEAAKASLLENLANTKATLHASLQLSKTTKETELAKLDNLTFPLSEKQRLTKTAEINTKANPELVSQIDKLVANAKETILRTADQATKSGLQAEILNLEKERASISAETLKDKTAIELNKIIPLQDALERKQFEIQKSLEESLGIFNEETVVMSQRLSQEDTITLLYKEQAKLKEQSQGMSEKEKKVIQDKIDLTEKQLAQLNQIELMKAKIAHKETINNAQAAYEDAAAQNLPMAQAAKMGASGNFIGAFVTEETARSKSDTLGTSLSLSKQKLALSETQGGKGSEEWLKLRTEIAQTTTAMNDLAFAKDAVINQATADTMNSISDHFVAWANGAETVNDAFRGIAIDFAKMIQEMIMNELKLQAIKGITSLISSGFGFASGGSVGAGVLSSGVSSFKSGAGFATGGDVRGTGTGTSDSIPAVVPVGSYVLNAKASAKAKKNRLINLSHGEVVISPEQVASLGLDNLNTMNSQGYATGGMVGGGSATSSSSKGSKVSNITNINVTVPEGTSNPKQFGQDVAVELMKAVAREEAKKQVNMYDKQKKRG